MAEGLLRQEAGNDETRVQRAPDGALFVVPVDARPSSGPVAALLSTAGWAKAARRRWSRAWVLTPQGVLSPEQAVERGSGTGAGAGAGRPSGPDRPGWRRRLPAVAVTATKDARNLVRAARFAGAASPEPWRSCHLAFVWQRHELFQVGGLRLARSLGCPLVTFVAAPQVWEARRWGVERPGWGRLIECVGERPALRAADLVACTSEEVAEVVRATGVAAERVLVTPSGADAELFRVGIDGAGVRQSLGLDDRFVVGWTGSFRPFHGLDTALEAVSLLQAELPDLALLLVGDGIERHAIAEQARRRGLRNVVFTGTVPHEQVPRHLAAMDMAVVVDSGTQGFHYSPIKLREYLAVGLAVVAPDVGDIGRSLRHQVDGLLVERGSPTALAGAIRRLHGDRDLLRRLGCAAGKTAARQSTWDHQLERVVQALAVLPRRRPGSSDPLALGHSQRRPVDAPEPS